jgi:hypothetical protein
VQRTEIFVANNGILIIAVSRYSTVYKMALNLTSLFLKLKGLKKITLNE